MKFPQSKLKWYLIVNLVILFAFTLAGNIYFFQSDSLKNGKIVQVYNASYSLDLIGNARHLEKIKNQINDLQMSQAVNTFDEFTAAVKRVSEINDPSSDLITNLEIVRNSLLKLVGHTKMNQASEILAGKIESFAKLAEFHNWKTLGRTSQRMKNLMQVGKIPNIVRLRTVTPLLIKDLKLITETANASFLNPELKDLIQKEANSMRTELNLLEKFLSDFDQLILVMADLEKQLVGWLEDENNKMALSKLELQEGQGQIFWFLILLLFITVTSLLLLMYLLPRLLKSDKKRSENWLLQVVKEGILKGNQQDYSSFNQDTLDQVQKIADFVMRRMAFGRIFRETIPLPTILLDDSLNITWANKVFYSSWGLGDVDFERESISWDTLRKYTNLGENDPILEARSSRVAGIYQIQVKPPGKSNLTPFEMYVMPFLSEGKTKIILYFYELSSIEETITHQAQTLMGPVRKTLDALKVNQFNAFVRDQVAAEFEVAGIADVYQAFSDYEEICHIQKQNLVGEIDKLELEIGQLRQQFKEMNALLTQQFASFKRLIKELTQVKSHLITDSELMTQLESQVLWAIRKLKELSTAGLDLMGPSLALEQESQNVLLLARGLPEIAEELKDAHLGLEKLKNDSLERFETLRLGIKSFGSKGNNSSNNDFIEKQTQDFDLLKEAFRQFELGFSRVLKNLNRFELRSSDVIKTIHSVVNISADYKKLVTSYRSLFDPSAVEEISFTMRKYFNESQIIEEKMVKSTRSVLQICGNNQEWFKKVESITGENYNSEQTL